MKARDIERFFKEVDKRIEKPIQVFLTGGAAAILQGVERATQDIDFELHTTAVEATQKAVQQAGQITGITPQYAEDIDRWSSIVLPEKKSNLYAQIGKVEVRILDPALWAIGKLTRYLSSDVDDMRVVLKAAAKDAKACAQLWGRALGLSPMSSQQALFRRQVEFFFDHYSREIWGPTANPERLKQVFLNAARKVKQRK